MGEDDGAPARRLRAGRRCSAGRHDILIGARRGSSLAIGYGDGEMYVGSDALALAPFTNRISYLEDDDWVVLQADGCTIYQRHQRGDARDPPERHLGRDDRQGQSSPLHAEGDPRAAGGDRRHAAQLPRSRDARGRACRRCRSTGPRSARSPSSPAAPPIYAGLVAKYWFEQLARLPVEVDIASEFRYREPPMPENGVCIAVSQSGETADTLAALRYAKANGQTMLVGGQRAGERDRPRIRRRAADPGRPRDRRRLDQGLHHPARRAAGRLAIAAGRARGTLSEAERGRLLAQR